jgi:hypothetical protein
MPPVSGGRLANEGAPQQFGEYHLIERIAVGGMAEVWKARAYGLAGFEKTLVIKKILDDLARDEEFVKLFIDEARIAVLLQHQNIVQVFDLGTAEGTLYMAMEYVQGTDLSRLVKRVQEQEPFPVGLALFIASEVLKALRFAHERKDEQGASLAIVHCDISPHNVLISHAGEVKITDFGISRAAFQMASLHDTVRGKYAYMSPEQIDNQAVDGRSDLFSLGILLWEVLTGRRLFKGKNKDETLTRVKRAEVPSPRLYRAQISEELEGVILKSLARQSSQRYQSAAEMLDAIGMLMVREGHRVTNNDLAAFLQAMGPEGEAAPPPKVKSNVETLVVAALEVGSGAHPMAVDDISQAAEAVGDELVRQGAQIWEREGGSVLAVWSVEDTLPASLEKALDALRRVRQSTKERGGKLAVGLAPGKARIFADTRRPGRAWELAGPFFLARWMMNLSSHRGKIVMSAVASSAVPGVGAQRIGHVAIEEGRAIGIAEIA